MTADPYPHIPPGRYRAAFIGCEEGNAFGKGRLFARFQVTEPGPFFGVVLTRFYNVSKRPFLPRSHNLYRDYVDLIQRRPPRGLKPGQFLKGCEVLVEVVTVKHRVEGKRRIELPEDCWYSKIERPLRITAGSPPCGPSRRL